MNEIIVLTDYKNFFGSKYDDIPYRSGFNHGRLRKLFLNYGYETKFVRMVDAQNTNYEWDKKLVLYTSNEEPGNYYKDFIEDIIQYLALKKAILIPHFELLRANNNKSFMELYKKVIYKEKHILESKTFGSLEDIEHQINTLKYPIVFKPSSGAMGSGVRLANNEKELLKIIRKESYSSTYYRNLKEWLRTKNHKGYFRESKYQRKFILQTFIPELKNDWKVLIFGEQVYVLKRGIREKDFRASGSKIGYKGGSDADFPIDQLDFLVDFKNKINIPNISLDFVFDGVKGYIIEFQGIYFGLSTLNYCKEYFIKEDNDWVTKPKTFNEEELFVYSIDHFINSNKLN